jgi:alpha-beta hydrolase superfamily lysophospholipase
VFVHGLIEHSGRHANTALELVRQGFAVHAMDLRGHGKSEGRRGDVRSFDQYLLDLDVFFARVRAVEDDRPIFLMGNSMGGLIVSLWTALRKPQIAGLILTGALLELANELYPRLRHLAAAANHVVPWLRIPRIPYEWLSRDTKAVDSFRRDPLVCQRGFSVRVAAGALRAMKDLADHAPSLRDPLLILHGGSDRICGPAGSRALFAKAGSADKTLRVYDGLYHELLDEPEREMVLADLIAWLGQRAPRSANTTTTCHMHLVR